MKIVDEKRALATILANTRRKKRSADLLTVAQAFEFLRGLYGSQQAVSQKVQLSPEIVREFLKVLTLTPAVKGMVARREIDSLDVAYRLSKVKNPGLQLASAMAVAGLSSKDIRDVERMVSEGKLTADQSVSAVLESKLKDLHVFVLDFDEAQHRKIRDLAREARIRPPDLMKRVIVRWLEEQLGAGSDPLGES